MPSKSGRPAAAGTCPGPVAVPTKETAARARQSLPRLIAVRILLSIMPCLYCCIERSQILRRRAIIVYCKSQSYCFGLTACNCPAAKLPPVPTERDKPHRLLAPRSAQCLLHRRRKVVIAQTPEYAPKIFECLFVRFQERLLRRRPIGAVERSPARHTPHGKHLQLRPLAGQVSPGLVGKTNRVRILSSTAVDGVRRARMRRTVYRRWRQHQEHLVHK